MLPVFTFFSRTVARPDRDDTEPVTPRAMSHNDKNMVPDEPQADEIKDRTPEEWALIERNLKSMLRLKDRAEFREWFQRTYPEDRRSKENPASGE